VTSDNEVVAVFATLVIKGLHRRSPSNGWYQTWCKRVLEAGEENQLTQGDWLTYGQTTWSAGAPRPSYPIGHIGDIIVPDTPTKPLIFSTNATKIVFRTLTNWKSLWSAFGILSIILKEPTTTWEKKPSHHPMPIGQSWNGMRS